VIAAAALVVCLSVTTLWDVDFWWQLKTGEHLATVGMVRTELFTLTRFGNPRIESSWLYCWLLFRAWSIVGTSGVIILKAALVLLTFSLAAAAVGRREYVVVAGIVCIAALACSQRFVVRPESISYALLALFMFGVSRAERGRRWPAVVLPVAQIVWVNVHSFALLGPSVAILWFACVATRSAAAGVGASASNPGRRMRFRTAALIAITVTAACLVNPLGWRLLRVPIDQLRAAVGDLAPWSLVAGAGIAAFGVAACVAVVCIGATIEGPTVAAMPGGRAVRRVIRSAQLLGAMVVLAVAVSAEWRFAVTSWVGSLMPGAVAGEKAMITELAPPFVVDRRFIALFYYEWMIAIAVVAFLLRPRAGFWVLLMVSGLLLSLVAVRNIPVFCIVAIPVIGRGITDCWVWRRLVAEHRGESLRVIGACLLGSLALFQCRQVVTDRFWVRQGASMGFGLGETPHHFPIIAADFLDAHGLRGRVWCGHGLGSPLLARNNRVFIDSRAVDGLIDEYREMLLEPQRLIAFCDAERINVMVVEISQPGLIREIIAAGGWRLIHADPVAVVLVRSDYRPDLATLHTRDPVWTAAIRRQLPRPRPLESVGVFGRVSNPIPYHRTAVFCLMFGADSLGRQLLSDATTAYPPLFATAEEPRRER
jgi:hypothetical protein